MVDVAALWKAGRVREEFNGTVNVATTGTRLLQPNPNRVSVYFANNAAAGGNFAKIRPRRPIGASSDVGARLDAGGGDYAEDYEEIGDAISSDYFGVADTGAVDVFVLAREVY